MNFAKITRYLTKLRDSDLSTDIFDISLSWKRRFIFESTTTTDYREALFSKADNVFETLFSNTDNRIDDLTALIAKRLIIGDVPDRADQYDCVTLTIIDTIIWINLDPVHVKHPP